MVGCKPKLELVCSGLKAKNLTWSENRAGHTVLWNRMRNSIRKWK